MLKLTAFEFILRAIPESFLFIFAGFVFSNSKINTKKYIISSILLSISIYFIRMLPINYGVNTILVIIMQTVILRSINKIDVIQSIKSAIVVAICLFILEALNVLMLNIIFKEQFQTIMLNPILKIVYGLPSLIGFIIIISCYNISKKRKIKNV